MVSSWCLGILLGSTWYLVDNFCIRLVSTWNQVHDSVSRWYQLGINLESTGYHLRINSVSTCYQLGIYTWYPRGIHALPIKLMTLYRVGINLVSTWNQLAITFVSTQYQLVINLICELCMEDCSIKNNTCVQIELLTWVCGYRPHYTVTWHQASMDGKRRRKWHYCQ